MKASAVVLGASLVLGGLAAWWWARGEAHQPVALAPQGSTAIASPPPAEPAPAVLPTRTASMPARAPEWRLLGTMVNGADPKSSMAWVSLDGGEPRLMRIGEGTNDAQVVLAIAANSVRVGRRDGSTAVELPVRPLAAMPQAPRPRPPEVEVSPIVPPHADAVAPPAQESGTPGSPWAQRRAASAP